MSQLAPPSLDMVRIIQQSSRCFVYGALGFLPWVGLGLAIQALRLRRDVIKETGEAWQLPPVWCYWVLGLAGVWLGEHLFGLAGATTAFISLALAQALHVWRSFPLEPQGTWNPGRYHLLWGVMLALSGIYGTLAPVIAIGVRLGRVQ